LTTEGHSAALGRSQIFGPRRGEEKEFSEAPVPNHGALAFEKASLPSLPHVVFSVPPYYYPSLSCFLGKIIRAIYPQLAQTLPLTNRKWREEIIHHEGTKNTKRKEFAALQGFGARLVTLGMHSS
jgi:hypothetical protein